MKKITYLNLVLLLYSVHSFGQRPINTTRSNIKNLTNAPVTVAGSSTKKTIYNLKPDEKLYTDESFINLTSNGEQIEFSTFIGDKYFLHTNNKDFGPFSIPPKRIASMKYICTNFSEDGQSSNVYYLDLITGKKTGPFQSIENWCYINSGPNTQGYYYQKNNQFYVTVIGQAKDLGPYESVSLIKLAKSETEFIYKKNSEYFIYSNGKNIGPYKEMQIYYDEKSINPIYTYQDMNKKYYVTMNKKTFGPFESQPQFCYSKQTNNPKFFLYEKNGIYAGYFLLKDGTKIPGNDPNDQTSMIFSLGEGKWLKLEKTELIKAKSEGKNIYCSSFAPWYISNSSGYQFGPANVGDQYSSFCFTDDDIIFVAANPPRTDCDIIKNKSINNNSKSSYYFIDKNGTEGPIDEAYGKINQSDRGKTKTAFIINDRLYINKKFAGLSNIQSFKFTNPEKNDNWYAVAKNLKGDSLDLYINGDKVQSIPSYNTYFGNIFINSNSDFSYSYTIDQSSFFKSSFTKLLGPFQSVNIYNEPPKFLETKKILGFIANYTNIIIDGVDKGEGTALVCNQKSGVFNWLGTDGKTVNLYTYKP
ncbi:MAG: hypothetical protein ACK5AY_09235 [Bacteroidota bacterium]